MNPSHRYMRIILPNRMPSRSLDLRSRAVTETAQSVEARGYGDQAKRFAAVPQGTGRVFHRRRADRPSIRSSRSRPRSWRQRDIRARCPHGMAHAPARADINCHVRLRLDTVLGRGQRGNPARRYDLVPARQEALAWRNADDGDDAYRHRGKARRQDRRLDGKSRRRTISGLTSKETKQCRSANSARATWKSRPSASAAWD